MSSTTPPAAVQERLKFAVGMARQAGQGTLELFQQASLRVEMKEDRSPVTQADRAAELQMRAAIAEAFPDDAVLGEEFEPTNGTSGYRWILDPIDGTKSFICGVPLYATLVGLEHEGESVAGVIYIPALQEMVYAAVGGGAWYAVGDAAPQQTFVAKNAQLKSGVFVTSQVDTFAQRGAGQAYLDLEAAAYITRSWGDAYGYLLVATGRADVMVDPMMNVWDAAAVAPIICEAGGAFTDWQGKATIHSGEGIGASAAVLEEVLAITRPCPRLS
ncbi:histidinol-phosphatase [Lignipirellula cremea]|uniref:Histidinol-phosphatase n=1 Tax=Lignipirellula cremea TaxID=2528010 RepID=A0A518E043_9BACT|nr:histidinol-phosphatase [Lignipirellula cremea]QDU97453.1 Histidinol-phosphatase [Lignipirellula cremea]